MAFVKRPALAGSAAGSLILAAFLFRGVAPNSPPVIATGNKQGASAAGKGDESRQPKASENKWKEEGPWKASRQHFAGIQPEAKCPSLRSAPRSRNVAKFGDVVLALQKTNQSKALQNERSTVWCIPDHVKTSAMIAIAPDPVHSHFALGFDRVVEALQLSAESMNYVVDRYWLPWQQDFTGTNTPSVEESSENEKQPGLLLFRWNGRAGADKPEVLYVFLVSDTSTAGVNGTQFRNAVQYVQQVCGIPGKPAVGCKDGHIFVVGPSFSGSMASLSKLTDRVQVLTKARPCFVAYSGTVSSSSAIENQGGFDPNLPADHSSPRCVNGESGSHSASFILRNHLQFRSMVGDHETMMKRLLKQLQTYDYIHCDKSRSPEVAIISEAATTYGITATTYGSNPDSASDCVYTSFGYPREISSLRNASAASEPLVSSSPQTGATQGPAYLPFTLADRQSNASDEPPDFSRAQGPLSKEAVLMRFAAELRRGHYKYAGITGSNVVDVLFITRFLRTACPDLRLFILGSELLFEREQDNTPFIGTLSLTTYPLIGRNLDWTNPKLLSLRRSLPAQPPSVPAPDMQSLVQFSRLPFGDEYEQGLYNAALLVMEELAPLDNQSLPLLEVSDPFTNFDGKFHVSSSVLPVWMTTIGTGGYWPIQILPSASDATAKPWQMESQDFSPAWRGIAFFLTGFAFLQSWILCAAKPFTARFRDFGLVNAAAPQRFFFINAASASLAFALDIMATPAWKFGMYAAGYFVPFIGIFTATAITALVMSSCYLSWLLLKVRREDNVPAANRSYCFSVFFSALAWLAAAVCAWFWWQLHQDDPSHYGFFFAYRGVNLATGVSPVTPMLLLLSAIFLWSVFEILRLRFDDQVRPRLEVRSRFPGATTEQSIATSINKYLLHPSYIFTFILLYVAWLLALQPGRPFELFEDPRFGRLFEVLFCIAVALMLTSGLRLSQTWSQLSGLLRELERSPIRSVFNRLKEGGWSPIWQAGGRQAEWTNMVRSFEVIHQIRNFDNSQPRLAPGEDISSLSEDIKTALDKRDEIRGIVRPSSSNGASTNSKHQETEKTINSKEHDLAAQKPVVSSVKDSRNLDQLLCQLQGSLATVLNDIMRSRQKEWETNCSDWDDGNDFRKEDKIVGADHSREKPDPELKQKHRLEEYIALRYVAFIRGVLGNIRLWLILLAALFSLVLLSLNVYSFEPHRSLLWSFTTLFFVLGAVAIMVLMQAHRDPVISRITNTQPNELGLHFFVRVAALGAVPLLTLLATHFPSIGQGLLSFFQPGLEALK